MDGFILDKGFQVYLTDYSLGKKFLNYSNLNFCFFKPGAKIYKNSNFRNKLISNGKKRLKKLYSQSRKKDKLNKIIYNM